jgi:hypothetical protein
VGGRQAVPVKSFIRGVELAVSLYRSQHELLPQFKKGEAPHVNDVALGKHGR